ncbi:MAG: hypothetical protein LBG27_11940 [Spirochaetaceae bacterium]|jgi:hypothetical protein|nr:hypothetical protein [Spirochaetaceae bacterium]
MKQSCPGRGETAAFFYTPHDVSGSVSAVFADAVVNAVIAVRHFDTLLVTP